MNARFDRHLEEVTERLEMLAGHSTAPAMKSNEIHRLKGVPVPAQRKVVKAGYSFLSDSRDDNLAIWEYIWHNSAYLEVMSQALYFYQLRSLNRKEYNSIRGWSKRCSCWEHSDDLAKIYADVVEAEPTWVLPTLRQWNGSRNPWLRRMSMTSLIEYASKRTRFLPYEELISFVESLLDDDDYYVQKGLGWTVREIGNAYPQQIARFLEIHAARLAPQAWSGATKRMDRTEKARLIAIRKTSTRGRRRSSTAGRA